MTDPTREPDPPAADPAPEAGVETAPIVSAAQSDGDVTMLTPSAAADSLPSHLQSEALHQLRKLGDWREHELKRHELVIAEVQDHVRRQARTGRLLLLLMVGMLALLAALVQAIRQLRADQVQAAGALAATTLEVARVGGIVRDASVQSAAQLDGLGGSLAAQGRKLDAFQLGLHATVSDSIQSLRQEREAVVGGVRLALEDQNRQLIDREVALRNREQELQREVQRVRQERQRIIQEAIDKLSTLSKDAPAASPNAP